VKRPFTVLNVATSIDGRITTPQRDLIGFGGAEDRDRMDQLRADADAVLIGAGTLRDEDPMLSVSVPARIAARQAAGRPAQPVAAVVSGKLEFKLAGSRFFSVPGQSRWVFTGAAVAAARRAEVAVVAEIEPLPATTGGKLDLARLCERLYERGIRRLLVEGGGDLNFGMLRAGLVDEIRLTLCPLVFGGSAPGAFAGEGFTKGSIPALDLVALEQAAGGRLFLRYQARHRPT